MSGCQWQIDFRVIITTITAISTTAPSIMITNTNTNTFTNTIISVHPCPSCTFTLTHHPIQLMADRVQPLILHPPFALKFSDEASRTGLIGLVAATTAAAVTIAVTTTMMATAMAVAVITVRAAPRASTATAAAPLTRDGPSVATVRDGSTGCDGRREGLVRTDLLWTHLLRTGVFRTGA